MDSLEEERLRIEIKEHNELEKVIGGLNDFFLVRDLADKGKDVSPTALQWKTINKLASSIRITKKTSKSQSDDILSSPPRHKDKDSGEEDFETQNFDGFDTAAKRILINAGPAQLKSFLRKSFPVFLLLFSDCLLITTVNNNDKSHEIYDLHHIIWVKNMKINHEFSSFEDATPEEKVLIFEVMHSKHVYINHSINFEFMVDDEISQKKWVDDIENVLLGYHRETFICRRLGWYHDLILGTFHSAACIGDVCQLRRHLKFYKNKNISVDFTDGAGMSALHWAALRGHEICARILLENGANPELPQRGLNTCLHLAATRGYDDLVRLLIDYGANIRSRNAEGRDVLYMSVIFGHATKGLPWVLQVLLCKKNEKNENERLENEKFENKKYVNNKNNIDLNQTDQFGYTVLHICAQKNLVRPLKLLADAGADVNAKNSITLLTPLQMACGNSSPDIETVRVLLDRGAFPNCKDSSGHTALSTLLSNASNQNCLHYYTNTENDKTSEFPWNSQNNKSMQNTLEKVGDWVVKILPVLLEIVRKGGRFEYKAVEFMRPSFRNAIIDAKQTWQTKAEPMNFWCFVSKCERLGLGDDLKVTRKQWTGNTVSNMCLLCGSSFSITVRKHHCRSCGVLVCDECSSKRLQLSYQLSPTVGNEYTDAVGDIRSSISTTTSTNTSSSTGVPMIPDRVCDGCYNRLCEASISTTSINNFQTQNLKDSAESLLDTIQRFLASLEHEDNITSNSVFNSRESESNPGIGNVSSHHLDGSLFHGGDINLSRNGLIISRLDNLSKCKSCSVKFFEAADNYERSASKANKMK